MTPSVHACACRHAGRRQRHHSYVPGGGSHREARPRARAAPRSQHAHVAAAGCAPCCRARPAARPARAQQGLPSPPTDGAVLPPFFPFLPPFFPAFFLSFFAGDAAHPERPQRQHRTVPGLRKRHGCVTLRGGGGRGDAGGHVACLPARPPACPCTRSAGQRGFLSLLLSAGGRWAGLRAYCSSPPRLPLVPHNGPTPHPHTCAPTRTRAEDDILLRRELDDLAAAHPNFRSAQPCLLSPPCPHAAPCVALGIEGARASRRGRLHTPAYATKRCRPPCHLPPACSVYYVLNNPPKGWQGGKGFVTADMIK